MAVSESTGKAGDTPALIAKVAALQNLKEFAELNWTGSLRGLPGARSQEPRRHAHRLPARLRHDPVATGKKSTSTTRSSSSATTSSRTSSTAGATPSSASTSRSCSWSTSSRARPRATAPSAASSCCTARSARSKSTIARLLKKGIEEYSRTPEGALYTYDWVLPEKLTHITGGATTFKCPMHEEPLRLIPPEWRDKALRRARAQPGRRSSRSTSRATSIPACR